MLSDLSTINSIEKLYPVNAEDVINDGIYLK